MHYYHRASFGDALHSIQDMLEFIHDQVLSQNTDTSFIGDITITKKLHQMMQQLDTNIAKMKAAKKDAKYEIVISHYKPIWYNDFGKTLQGLSINLYGFTLSVQRESQIMHLKKLMQSSSYAPNHKSSQWTISRIEYGILSELHQAIEPDIKHFIHIALQAIQSIQCRLQDNKAIPPRHVFNYGTCDIEELQKGMQCLQNAKLIMQQQYETRGTEPTEDHYLIYTLLFSLSQFGHKLTVLETQANQLIARRKQGRRLPRIFFPSVNFKKWLGRNKQEELAPQADEQQVIFENQHLRQKEEEHQKQGSSTSDDSNRETKIRKSMESDEDWMEKQQPLQHARGKHRWNRALHSVSEFFKTDPIRYAIKFAITTEILALMAWLPVPGANDLYNNNHGQWALLTCMVVFNFTVGSTALQCFFRILATVIGAVCGYICLLAGNRRSNPYVLAVLVGVFQIPMWYSLLANKYPRIGFISLLTMAVIVSTGYFDQYNEDLFAPVWKRTLTSIIAIIVVMLVNQLVWPAWARKLLRKQLSDLLIATGIQYSKVASLVCQENTKSHRYLSTLHDCEYSSKMLRKQHQLVSQMLALAASEPRLTKGPFPQHVYRDILHHELNMLYWIDHLLKTQSFVSENVRKKVMNPVNPYRKELAAAVHLYLFTLAGSLRTKSSLPASLPSAESARQVLQNHQRVTWASNFNALRRLDSGHSDTEETVKQERGAENNIYWQTYAAGSIEVIFEQEEMARLIIQLMGQHVFKAATKDWIV